MSASDVNLFDTNVSNFVSVKLSGNNNYDVWKSQMLCMLDSNNMGAIVDPTFVGPKNSDTGTMRQYDSLARGWILGSLCEDVLAVVHNLSSAKAVWEKLQYLYDSRMNFKDDKKGDKDVSAETNTVEEGGNSIEITVDQDIVSKNSDTDRLYKFECELTKRQLCNAATYGDWSLAEVLLKQQKDLVKEAIDSDGSTVLHIAVGTGHNDFLEQLFPHMNDEHLLQQRDSDGSTALHIAAIVGNTHAADLLVKRKGMLLRVKDYKGVEPLHYAYKYMHLDTIGCLLKAVDDGGKTELQSSFTRYVDLDDDIGVDVLANAISAKQYSLASDLLEKFPEFASKSDEVLLAIAKTFPSGLNYWESLVYPSFGSIRFTLFITARSALGSLVYPMLKVWMFIRTGSWSNKAIGTLLYKLVILTVPAWLVSSFLFICLPIIIVFCPLFCFLYSLWWKGAKILSFAPIKQIENKKKDLYEAKIVLNLVCDEINKLENFGSDHYTRPILEAACQNTYEVVDTILHRSPKAIQSKDKSGFDIIQLAILNRSEEIYNLIYDIGERKNLYRTYTDSYKNNILHLAGRLAPSSVLNQRTGAALQLQRELQWREEVKKFVFPTYITQENIFMETPDMVFTREHKDLVKEGEQWMKTTAESCSITAALITTIVFAAAITVPGGNNQEKGTPLFRKESAFIIFAISDAISLFASSTALLVFLSILTARFAEKDFLVILPRRLFIGLFSLLLSTTTMMIAFSATLYLVFCDKKPWMLIPISGLAFIPIVSFVALQFPLMVDLFRSTYLPMFGKKEKIQLNLLLRTIFIIGRKINW